MIVRRIVLFVGAVAMIIGVVGMLAPISVSPELQTVACGNALAPNLSDARARDDGTPANFPVPGGVVVDTNYTRLCQMEVDDRRIWTVTLAAVGALAIVGALAMAARSKRAMRSSPSPAAEE